MSQSTRLLFLLLTSFHFLFAQGQALDGVLEGKITSEEFAANLQKMWDDNWPDILKKAGLTEDNLTNPAVQPGS